VQRLHFSSPPLPGPSANGVALLVVISVEWVSACRQIPVALLLLVSAREVVEQAQMPSDPVPVPLQIYLASVKPVALVRTISLEFLAHSLDLPLAWVIVVLGRERPVVE
jgi:hypothetical protein